MKIEIDVEVPSGWQFDSFRRAKHGDRFLGAIGDILIWGDMEESKHPTMILRKKPKRYRVFEEVGVQKPQDDDMVQAHEGVVGYEVFIHGTCERMVMREVTDQVTVTENSDED